MRTRSTSSLKRFPAHASLTSHNIVLCEAKIRAMRFLVQHNVAVSHQEDELTEPVMRRTLTDDFMIMA